MTSDGSRPFKSYGTWAALKKALMEKSSEKKLGNELVTARLMRMARVMNEAVRTEVQSDGTVIALDKPTILRTPAAHASGELVSPGQEVVRVELPAAKQLSLSDVGDHSTPPLQRTAVDERAPRSQKASPRAAQHRVPSEGGAPSNLESPQDEVIGIDSSAERRTQTDVERTPSSCARASPYLSPRPNAADALRRSEKEREKKKKAKKADRKRARVERRAEEPQKKKRTGPNAGEGTSTVPTERAVPEEGRRAENTTVELPLYTAQALEGGYFKFASKTLSNGLQNKTSRLTQAAILATHSAHNLFCAAKEEAQMLADKKKYQVLVRAHEARAKEVEEKVAKMDELQAELMDKTNRYESVQAALDEQTTELEMEVALKQMFNEQLESAQQELQNAQQELAEAKALAAAERQQKEAMTVDRKELEEAKARAVKLEEELKKTSAAVKEQELKWKQEAYYEGVDTNFRILTHYGALDLPKFLTAAEDPVAQANAPRETYAEQWGHLEPGAGGENAA